MSNSIPIRGILITASLAAAGLAGGCTSSRYDRDLFDYDLQQSRTRAILDAQYAKGAAVDASLSAAHFDGDRLNGLGRDKLDRMMAAGAFGNAGVVYVDVAVDDPARGEMKRRSVGGYLTASGIAATEAMVVLGQHPEGRIAEPEVMALQRMRDEPGGGASFSGAAVVTAPGGSGGGLFANQQ